MSIKNVNEITVKLKDSVEDVKSILEKEKFKIVDKFYINDIYCIPSNIDVKKMSVRDILKQAVLIRDIDDEFLNERIKRLTYKVKDINENGEILNQKIFNCSIININDAKDFLQSIGYKEIMQIAENDVEYEKDSLNILIKEIVNGDNLIEVETNEKLDSIDKIKKEMNKLDIKYYEDNYFVKKAEIKLNEVISKI